MMHFEKYHGLRNDFLVLIDLEGRWPLGEEAVRALCDRHAGVGADGLIRVTAGTAGADVTMELHNSDGSQAETSGNGLRCLARAVVAAGVAGGPRLTVATGAGVRELRVNADGTVTVDMGPAGLAGPDPATGGRRSMQVDMGNPHLVVEAAGAGGLEAAWESLAPPFADRNVEVVAPGPGPDELTMRVWERGAGETQACGTGACAAAAAFHHWGLVGPRVTVHQPGGAAVVELKPETILLTGPAEHVCAVDVPWL